jgi:hypothetical protein
MHKKLDKHNVAAGGILEHIMRISPSWNRHKPIYKPAYVRILKRKFSGTVLEEASGEMMDQQPRTMILALATVNIMYTHSTPMGAAFTAFNGGCLQEAYKAFGLRGTFDIGDTVNNILPVGAMNAPDVKHLDNLPSPNNEAQRPSQKPMADICFVCTYIQSKVQEHGLWT